MPERDNRKTLSEIGLTAKESSTFKQIDSPGPGHHRQDAGEIAKQDDGRPISVPSCNTYRTLTDIGISRRESSTFKQIAAPTLATIGRMPGRLRNRTPEVQILKTVCQSGIPLKPFQKLD